MSIDDFLANSTLFAAALHVWQVHAVSKKCKNQILSPLFPQSQKSP